MSSWIDSIGQFSAVIRTGVEFEPGIAGGAHYPATRGAEVYRNNYRGNLQDTLAGAYPVIRQLVGDEFFRWLAKCYIEKYFSRSGNLHYYGSEMAAFLLHFESTRKLLYLPDMARLEWAYHHAYFARDVTPFDLNRLAMLAAQSYDHLLWRLHPSCALLTPAYPVVSIWQAHQEDSPADFNIDLNAGGDNLLVYRNGLNVEFFSIDAANHHCLTLLQQGTAMGEATEATLSAYPYFDLATTLRHWLAQGVLFDFDIAQEQQFV